MLLSLVLATILSASGALARVQASKVTAAPATTTTVICTVVDCPAVDLEGDGLFSMDQNDFTDTLTCLWRFPLQPLVEGDYNLVSDFSCYRSWI